MSKRKFNVDKDDIQFADLQFENLIEIDIYTRTFFKEKIKVKRQSLEQLKCLHKYSSSFLYDLKNENISIDSIADKCIMLGRLKELCKQIIDTIFQLDDLREYNMKIDRGSISDITLFYLTRYSLLNLIYYLENSLEDHIDADTYEMEYNGKFQDYDYLRRNLLFIHKTNKKLENFTQMEILLQLECLQKRWNDLDYNTNLVNLINHIELRLAQIICNYYMIEDGIIDSKNESFVKIIQDKILCSTDFIERATCIISSMIITTYTVQFILLVFKENTIESPQILNRENQKKFAEWLKEENKAVEDENFRDRVRNEIVKRMTRPGEKALYMKKTHGVKPSDQITILEKVRPILQTTWITMEAYKTADIIKDIKDIETIEYFNIFSKSRTRFNWIETCYFENYQLLENLEEIICRGTPTVIHIMNFYILIHKYNSFICSNIEISILLWCKLLENENNSIWMTDTHTFDLGNIIEPIYDRFLIPNTIQSKKEEKEMMTIDNGVIFI